MIERIADIQKRLPERVTADVFWFDVFLGWFSRDRFYTSDRQQEYLVKLTPETKVKFCADESDDKRWIVEMVK